MKSTAKKDFEVMLKAGFKYLELLALSRSANYISADLKVSSANPHLLSMFKQKFHSQRGCKFYISF